MVSSSMIVDVNFGTAGAFKINPIRLYLQETPKQRQNDAITKTEAPEFWV